MKARRETGKLRGEFGRSGYRASAVAAIRIARSDPARIGVAASDSNAPALVGAEVG